MARKTKQFYFPFFPQDWFTGTAHMTNTQKGLYIDLLTLQSQKGELPLNLFYKLGEGIEEDVQVVLENFKKSAKGNYYNPKLREITLDIKKRLDGQRNGGKKSQEIQKKKREGTEVSSDVSSEKSLSNARLTLEQSVQDSIGISEEEPKPYNSLDELYNELSTDR